MCECGCVANDRRYTLPGPGRAYYLITLRGHCVECDGPSAVLIEMLSSGSHDHKYYKDPDMTEGPLPLTKWLDNTGCNIATGMTQQEFIAKLMPQIVGLDSEELADGPLDAAAAEVVIEEMYDDAQTFPLILN